MKSPEVAGMDKEVLFVMYKENVVGRLWCGMHEEFVFEYSRQWLDSTGSFPVSLSLPFQDKAFSDQRVRRFFTNLLPEGALRRITAGRLGISEDNDFALLKAIGGECAGALSVVTQDNIDSAENESGYQLLSKDEITELVSERNIFSSVAGRTDARLSLAGVHDKLPVYVDNDRFYLPMGNSPSSHILKFPSRDFRHLPENEVFTSLLAKSTGLNVVDVELRTFGKKSVCLVTRYDRYTDSDGKLMRIHQEDFCQAMGLSHNTKYEQEGGPGFRDCYNLVTEVSDEPLPDDEQLLKWIVFNLVSKNADGHAKNLSLVHADGSSTRLAPFYDIVCTGAYGSLDRHLAMRIGKNADPGHVSAADWAQLSTEIGVGEKYLLDSVREATEHISDNLAGVADDFKSRFNDSPVLDTLPPLIRKQARRTQKLLKAIP